MEARISVWTAYYVDLSPEDAVREFKKNGYSCAELSDEHGLMLLQRGEPAVIGARFRAFLADQNFSMPQGHLWLSAKLCSDPESVPTLAKWLELYEAIGIENAVLHCDSMAGRNLAPKEIYACNLEALQELCSLTRGLKIRICLENLPGIYCDADSLITIVDRLDPDRFGICLDTGHLNLSGGSQREFILRAGHRLHALHIADNEGERDQHIMPFGCGNVDFSEVVAALREVDYRGLFNLEISGERRAPLPVRGYKLEYIARSCRYLLEN